MNKTKVIIRADGNKNIGLGHVVRSLALAEMLNSDFDITFAIQEPDKLLIDSIQKVCQNLIKLDVPACHKNPNPQELDSYLTGKEIVVLDGYSFNTAYQKHIKAIGCTIVCIDDIHSYHFVADAIINHAGGVSKEFYSLAPYTKCYLGPEYALLRSPFLIKGEQLDFSKTLQKLFINMGGADPKNHTCQIVSQLFNLPYFEEVHIVTGAAYRYSEALDNLIVGRPNIYRHDNLDAEAMAILMQKCGAAICPPSSVCYEYASVGGLLFLLQIADNQSDVKRYFLQNQLAYDFEMDFDTIMANQPEESYWEIVKNQKTILDGKSNERLLRIFKRIDLMASLQLRAVQLDDMLLCYQWANDPSTRLNSFNSSFIPLEDHQKWFNKKCLDIEERFYIAEINGKPVGQIRFEGKREYLISYVIAPEMRGYGLGYKILINGIKMLLKVEKEVRKISGYVKKSNTASCKIFEKAGFESNIQEEFPYPDSLKYEFSVNVE